MPSLTPEYQEKLLRYMDYNCTSCGKQVYKDYCRQCDEFLFLCDPACPHNDVEHEGHRRYDRRETGKHDPSSNSPGPPNHGDEGQ